MDLPDKTAAQPPKKVIVPVASSKAVKRPASKRFFDFLFAESPKVILRNIATNVLVPRAKAGLEEAGNIFLASMMWGDPSNRPMSNVVKGTVIRGGVVNYAGLSNGQPGMSQAMHASPSRETGGNYRDLVFGTLQDAEKVLANLYDLMNQYRIVAVGDLYELASQPTSPSDNGFGWTSLDGARISRARDGFVLELPRPSLL